jgi:hypothetical protein
MKKAIFLVEDIKDGTVITLLESIYEKLIVKLNEEGLPFLWISETACVLNHCPSDYITFKKATEFIEEIEKNGKSLPKDVEIFYFISAWLNTNTFHITNFFALDPKVTDFLVKNRISIIIDGSMEHSDVYSSSYNLFEGNLDFYKNNKGVYFRGIPNLRFYVIGGDITTNYHPMLERRTVVEHRSFPTAFFRIAYFNSAVHSKAVQQKQILFDQIKERKITSETRVWQAFCKTPRLTRILFQLWVDKENLTQFGRYSRLSPAKDVFLREAANAGIFNRYSSKLNFITKKHLKKLDVTHHIDITGNKNSDGLPFTTDSMFHIVLETCFINSGEDFSCTPSMLTEKTSMAILSGVPFITLGGHRLKKILESLGFREYKGLELPDVAQENFFDELEYVLEKVKAIIKLPLDKKQDLYESWKENIIHNYEIFLSSDTKKAYIQSLNYSI